MAIGKINIQKNKDKIKKISKLVETKLSQFESKSEQNIEKLSFDELQDLNQITRLADYVLCKYETKKDVVKLLKEFVDMINSSANSTEILNDEINELIITAEESVNRIKNLHNSISENFSIESKPKSNMDILNEPKNSRINLTKSTTPIYTRV